MHTNNEEIDFYANIYKDEKLKQSERLLSENVSFIVSVEKSEMDFVSKRATGNWKIGCSMSENVVPEVLEELILIYDKQPNLELEAKIISGPEKISNTRAAAPPPGGDSGENDENDGNEDNNGEDENEEGEEDKDEDEKKYQIKYQVQVKTEGNGFIKQIRVQSSDNDIIETEYPKEDGEEFPPYERTKKYNDKSEWPTFTATIVLTDGTEITKEASLKEGFWN